MLAPFIADKIMVSVGSFRFHYYASVCYSLFQFYSYLSIVFPPPHVVHTQSIVYFVQSILRVFMQCFSLIFNYTLLYFILFLGVSLCDHAVIK